VPLANPDQRTELAFVLLPAQTDDTKNLVGMSDAGMSDAGLLPA
jgi:hypothetical protein